MENKILDILQRLENKVNGIETKVNGIEIKINIIEMLYREGSFSIFL